VLFLGNQTNCRSLHKRSDLRAGSDPILGYSWAFCYKIPCEVIKYPAWFWRDLLFSSKTQTFLKGL